jgi:type I restriction enzyme M protein
MNNNTSYSSGIVSEVWAFCNTLRYDDAGYGDYLEQLTYLLFLKMADAYSRPQHNRKMLSTGSVSVEKQRFIPAQFSLN